MAISFGNGNRHRVKFSASELTGALGDSVTVLPIVVAVAALTPLPLGRLLLGFAVFQVVWGLHYGLPVSVEPMKALAALVVAGSFSVAQLAAAGLFAGVALLAVGATGTLGRVERYVGRPVVRGIQLAVALLLFETGVGLSLDAPLVALGALALAGAAVVAGHRRASALVVLLAGGLVAGLDAGVPSPAVPALAVGLPALETLLDPSTVEGTVAQLGMTVGNAAVATSLLLSDYFDAEVSADELASSMGVMNLLAVPLGALPMCHGSGGVAGKYAFGARTAGANVVLGGLYAAAAVAATGLVAAFPLAALGVVLAIVAAELGRASLGTDHLPLTLGVGAVGLLANVGVAFLAGVAAHLLLSRRSGGSGR